MIQEAARVVSVPEPETLVFRHLQTPFAPVGPSTRTRGGTFGGPRLREEAGPCRCIRVWGSHTEDHSWAAYSSRNSLTVQKARV